MVKGKWAIWGPFGEGGGSPLGLGAKGGPHPPMASAPPPLGGLVPHGEGEEDAPLGLYKEGYTPLFPYNLKFALFSLSPTSSGLHLLGVCTWLGVLHQSTSSLCRSRDPNPCSFLCLPGP